MTAHAPTRRSSGLSLALRTAVVLAVFTVPAVAQTRPARSSPFSLVAGLNLADMSLPLAGLADDIGVEVATDARRGFIGGVLAEVPLSARVSFDTGALLSVRGAAVAASVPGFGTVSTDLRMVYVDVPAHARVTIARSPGARVGLFAGPTVGVRVHGRSRLSLFGEVEDETITSELPVLDFALAAGVRVDAGHFVARVSYTHGLTDTAKGNAPQAVEHRVVSLVAGWRF